MVLWDRGTNLFFYLSRCYCFFFFRRRIFPSFISYPHSFFSLLSTVTFCSLSVISLSLSVITHLSSFHFRHHLSPPRLQLHILLRFYVIFYPHPPLFSFLSTFTFFPPISTLHHPLSIPLYLQLHFLIHHLLYVVLRLLFLIFVNIFSAHPPS